MHFCLILQMWRACFSRGKLLPYWWTSQTAEDPAYINKLAPHSQMAFFSELRCLVFNRMLIYLLSTYLFLYLFLGLSGSVLHSCDILLTYFLE